MRFLRSNAQTARDSGLRDTLFGDVPLDRWPPVDAPAGGFPWSAFTDARAHLAAGSIDAAKDGWRMILADPGLETRHHLQAWTFLREQGDRPPEHEAKDVLGVVVELALPDGLDMLAVYADRSARYYNHAGGGIVLERAQASVAERINHLLAAAATVVIQIGPWEEVRPGPPRRRQARLSILTPSGLHFGEGPIDALGNDPLAGPLLQAATTVMTDLVATSTPD